MYEHSDILRVQGFFIFKTFYKITKTLLIILIHLSIKLTLRNLRKNSQI